MMASAAWDESIPLALCWLTMIAGDLESSRGAEIKTLLSAQSQES